MSEPTQQDAAGVLYELFTQSSASTNELLSNVDRLQTPVVVTEADPGGSSILYCNDAFMELCGYPREEMIGASPRILQGEATDKDAAQRFITALRRDGHGHTRLLNYKKDGTPYLVEIYGVRASRPTWLDGGGDEVFLAFELPLGAPPVTPDSYAGVSECYRVALHLETLLRRYIRQNYRQGMHPAQWSALRYFKLAPPDARTLTGFAKAHHTTMGTASTTVSTLVGKGYLKKHSFRGPIEVTGRGEALLRQDPLGNVARALEEMSAEDRQHARRVLTLLAERLDEDDRG